VYRRGADADPVFVEVPAPTPEALQAVLHLIITRSMKLLTRRAACWSKSRARATFATTTQTRTKRARCRPLQAAAFTYRIACGARAGHKVLTLHGAMPRQAGFDQGLCADIDGFSLPAAVRGAADDRKALAQLCRYITRPALANERVQCNAAGQVVLELKTPWRDGTTHLVMDLDFNASGMLCRAAPLVNETTKVGGKKHCG